MTFLIFLAKFQLSSWRQDTRFGYWWMWLWRGIISPAFWSTVIHNLISPNSHNESIAMGFSIILFTIIRYWKLYWFSHAIDDDIAMEKSNKNKGK